MRRFLVLSIAFFAATVPAPAQDKVVDQMKALFDKAETVVVFSLNPDPKVAEVKDGFHGWEVLGKTELKGAAERKRLISPRAIRVGDVLLGLPSTGLHTNGYSLARKLLLGRGVNAFVSELGSGVGDELLKVHRSYLKPIRALLKAALLHGAAHITGGGITDNTPRMLPDNMAAAIDTRAWTIPPVFELMRNLGDIPEDDYRRTFNLGVGMILAVPARKRAEAERLLRRLGEKVFVIGEVIRRKRGAPRVEYR